MSEYTNKQVVDLLQSLAQYEIDSTFIIGQAIACASNSKLREKLTEIREECENNIQDISSLIMQYGGSPPEHSRDFKGFFMQGYVGMRGLMSDEGVMKALTSNASLMADAFQKAIKNDLPTDVKNPLTKIYNNVQQHLECFAKGA